MENMGHKMIVPAPAKINLALSVGARRPDGYHEIESIMQQISLNDMLVFESREGRGWDFYCTEPLLNSKDNLVCRAAVLLEEYCCGKNLLPGVSISLYKVIPAEAGLGGGSSDGAAALVALNNIWKIGLTEAELLLLAGRLGSDVPFFIRAGTAMVYGRGEKLLLLPDLPFYWVVIAVPNGLSLSTASVYASHNPAQASRPALHELLNAIRWRDRKSITKWYAGESTNTLEDAVVPYLPQINNIKARFREVGLLPAMSGSGPSLFALSDSFLIARSAARVLQRESCRVYLCWTVGHNS